jgi:hypothetical protein
MNKYPNEYLSLYIADPDGKIFNRYYYFKNNIYDNASFMLNIQREMHIPSRSNICQIVSDSYAFQPYFACGNYRSIRLYDIQYSELSLIQKDFLIIDFIKKCDFNFQINKTDITYNNFFNNYKDLGAFSSLVSSSKYIDEIFKHLSYYIFIYLFNMKSDINSIPIKFYRILQNINQSHIIPLINSLGLEIDGYQVRSVCKQINAYFNNKGFPYPYDLQITHIDVINHYSNPRDLRMAFIEMCIIVRNLI